MSYANWKELYSKAPLPPSQYLRLLPLYEDFLFRSEASSFDVLLPVPLKEVSSFVGMTMTLEKKKIQAFSGGVLTTDLPVR